MKHESPLEIARAGATVIGGKFPGMSRRERLERWAELVDHEGLRLNTLRGLEYLTSDERRMQQAANSPLTIAYRDPVLRAEGLAGPRLGDAMDFFGLSDGQAHRLLCDCHYMGDMTGPRLARNLRRHVFWNEVFSKVSRAAGRLFGRA
jgi:hypothetical protein